MRVNLAEPPGDLGVGRVATRQHGIITRAQLNDLGLDRSAIDRRVKAGRLHRLHRNVYAVGHKRLTNHGRYLSAVLSLGEKAVLSHRSAAILWRIQPEGASKIDVTVPAGGTRGRRVGVTVHRSPLGPGDTTVRDRIPVTTPSRTLVDLADVLTLRELERAIDEAHFLRLDLSSMQPVPGRRGTGVLNAVLGHHAPGTTRTRSEFEELLLAFCRDQGLPQPLVNQIVEGFEADFVWPNARLIVEADSWTAHGRRGSFERDRLRDAALQVAGWRVLRITWRRLLEEPDRVAGQIAALIAGAPRA